MNAASSAVGAVKWGGLRDIYMSSVYIQNTGYCGVQKVSVFETREEFPYSV